MFLMLFLFVIDINEDCINAHDFFSLTQEVVMVVLVIFFVLGLKRTCGNHHY